MIFFACFILAMFVTLCLIPPLMHMAPRWQFVDAPDERKVHKNLIPRIGGIAMVAGALLPMLIWLPGVPSTYYLIAAIAILLFFGAWDDRKNLDFRIKLVGQIIAATLVVVCADVRVHWLPFLSGQELYPPLAIGLSIFALVGITNALNLVDGLDGLAGGTTLLGFALVALLAYLAQDFTLVIISLGVMGATLGFLRFNTHPASIFMGDSGSQFLGFVAGILCIRLTQQADVGLSPLFPLVLLGIPIFDTLVVMSRRVAQGKSPFSPDRNHIHHRLLDAGFDHYEVVVIIYILQGLLSVVSYTLRYNSDVYLAVFLAAFFGVLFTCLAWADRHKGFFARKANTGLRTLAQPQRVIHYGYRSLKYLLGAALIAIVLTCCWFTTMRTLDLFSLSAVLGVVFIAALLQRASLVQLLWYERIALYILCSLCIFFYYHIHPGAGFDRSFLLIAFLCLLAFVILAFQFSSDLGFELSPLDYLLIFITLSLSFYPTPDLVLRNIAFSASSLIVLFYIVEFILVNALFSARQIRLAAAGTCAAICVILIR